MHSYIYNFGDNPINFSWVKENNKKDNLLDKIMPGDSIYVEPFVKHAFSSIDDNAGKLFIFRVSGAVSLEVQKANRAAFDYFGLTPFYPQCDLDII